MVGVGCQQKSVFPIQPLFVVSIPPRLAVTGAQVLHAINSRQSAPFLNRHDTFFVQALTTARRDNCLASSLRQ